MHVASVVLVLQWTPPQHTHTTLKIYHRWYFCHKENFKVWDCTVSQLTNH